MVKSNPFIFSVFPCDRNMFCVIIISNQNNDVLKNLLFYVINSHIDSKYSIIDLSFSNLFEDIQGILSPNKDSVVPSWVNNIYFKNMLNSEKSYTIWLCDSIENLPVVVKTKSDIIFNIDNQSNSIDVSFNKKEMYLDYDRFKN